MNNQVDIYDILNEYLIRDIKQPIHQSMNFLTKYFFLLYFCIAINLPFLNLEGVPQNAFHIHH